MNLFIVMVCVCGRGLLDQTFDLNARVVGLFMHLYMDVCLWLAFLWTLEICRYRIYSHISRVFESEK